MNLHDVNFLELQLLYSYSIQFWGLLIQLFYIHVCCYCIWLWFSIDFILVCGGYNASLWKYGGEGETRWRRENKGEDPYHFFRWVWLWIKFSLCNHHVCYFVNKSRFYLLCWICGSHEFMMLKGWIDVESEFFFSAILYECWWILFEYEEVVEERRWREGKNYVVMVHHCIQWTCNRMVEILSEMLDIKKLSERTKIVNDRRFIRPNWNTL